MLPTDHGANPYGQTTEARCVTCGWIGGLVLVDGEFQCRDNVHHVDGDLGDAILLSTIRLR